MAPDMEAVVSPPPGITGRVEDPYGDTLGGRSRDPEPTFLAGGAWVPEYYPASSALDVGEPQPSGFADQKPGQCFVRWWWSSPLAALGWRFSLCHARFRWWIVPAMPPPFAPLAMAIGCLERKIPIGCWQGSVGDA
jgi:hypothetical protein